VSARRRSGRRLDSRRLTTLGRRLDPDQAALLIDKPIAGCTDDDVEEIQSLGNTLARWRQEILAHHDTGASNRPTEGLNLCVKKVKRCGHVSRSGTRGTVWLR
jgi:transposase